MINFTQYYDLKDDNKLPSNAYFLDPYDGQKFYPNKTETLTEFVDRLAKIRSTETFPNELRILVSTSLANTASPRDLNTFFVIKSLPPTSAQVYAFARAMISQILLNKQASFVQRQDRATKCASCPFHKKTGRVNAFLNKVIQKVVGIEEMMESKLEKELGTCGMCGCGLTNKVKFNIEGVIAGVAPDQLKSLVGALKETAFERCWILEEASQDDRIKRILESKLTHAGPAYVAHFLTYLAKMRVENGKK